ncbi:hypothetical protein [Shouchella shacheensis]|uniref:hypothetical protein n=1 Tax=Shouchella shacheensis TaxID=1649580 RepID=UPI0007404002|nr:hypothetical protein [Shouchella shacheensis]
MPKKQSKIYKSGDRLQVYLSNSISDEFIDWINEQSDKSGFFLYAAAKLYEQTGRMDVSEILPRKLVLKDSPSPPIWTSTETLETRAIQESAPTIDTFDDYGEEETVEKVAWAGTELGDDDTWG